MHLKEIFDSHKYFFPKVIQNKTGQHSKTPFQRETLGGVRKGMYKKWYSSFINQVLTLI